jgi:hypothetical protein
MLRACSCNLNVCDQSILSFWTLSIALFIYWSQCFGEWILSPSSGKLRLAQCVQIDRTSPYFRIPKSESRYHWRSVVQCVLVWSRVWGTWPYLEYCLTVPSCLCTAPSLTRGRVFPLSVLVCSHSSLCTWSIYILHVWYRIHVYTIYKRLLSA